MIFICVHSEHIHLKLLTVNFEIRPVEKVFSLIEAKKLNPLVYKI